MALRPNTPVILFLLRVLNPIYIEEIFKCINQFPMHEYHKQYSSKSKHIYRVIHHKIRLKTLLKLGKI